MGRRSLGFALAGELALARPKHDPSATPTQDRILAAAEVAFGSAGYDRAGLAEIARAVGIRRPSLLYHFESKERLYSAVVERTFGKLASALTAAMALEGSFPERLDALTHGYLAFLDAEPSFAPLVLRELIDGQGPGRDLIMAQLVPLLDALEAFLDSEGAEQTRPGLPWRAAILQLGVSPLLRAASGPLREPLWGSDETLPALARALILKA